jgi:hypothetical protein
MHYSIVGSSLVVESELTNNSKEAEAWTCNDISFFLKKPSEKEESSCIAL